MYLTDIENWVKEYFVTSPLNIVPELNNLKIFDLPLLGIASAEDPLFAQLKKPEAVGPFHFCRQNGWQAAGRLFHIFFRSLKRCVLPIAKQETRQRNGSTEESKARHSTMG